MHQLINATAMSRAYGGKLGVWLTKKRKNNGPSKRLVAVAGSFLPGKLMRKLNRRKGDNLSTQKFMMGWDDVRCRPIYYNNDVEEQDEDEDLPKKTDSETCSASGEDDSFVSLSFPSKDMGNQDGEDAITSTRASKWAETANSGTAKTKSNKKQTYGNQKKGGRQLSNMATSVLDHCASPPPRRKVDSKSFGNVKRGGMKRARKSYSSDRSITDASTMSFSSIDVLSFNDGFAPPSEDSVLCLEREIDSQGNIDSSHSGSGTPRGRLMDSAGLQVPQDARSKDDKSLTSKKRKIRVKERHASTSFKSQPIGKNSDSNGVRMSLRQPTFATSLLEAKAYYDHLDATHTLKIE